MNRARTGRRAGRRAGRKTGRGDSASRAGIGDSTGDRARLLSGDRRWQRILRVSE